MAPRPPFEVFEKVDKGRVFWFLFPMSKQIRTVHTTIRPLMFSKKRRLVFSQLLATGFLACFEVGRMLKSRGVKKFLPFATVKEVPFRPGEEVVVMEETNLI